MDVAKKLFPNSGELIRTNDGNFELQLVDCELDPIKCYFVDGVVELDVSEYGYISFSVTHLEKLIEAIEEVRTKD